MKAFFIFLFFVLLIDILEMLGMSTFWACVCVFLPFPLFCVICAIIDKKTGYFSRKNKERIKERRAQQELFTAWKRDQKEEWVEEWDEEWDEDMEDDPEYIKMIEREIDQIYEKKRPTDRSTVGFPGNCGNGGGCGFGGF